MPRRRSGRALFPSPVSGAGMFTACGAGRWTPVSPRCPQTRGINLAPGWGSASSSHLLLISGGATRGCGIILTPSPREMPGAPAPLSRALRWSTSLCSCGVCCLARRAVCRLAGARQQPPRAGSRVRQGEPSREHPGSSLGLGHFADLAAAPGSYKAERTAGLAEFAPQGLNSPGVGTRSTINNARSRRSRGVALVYQRVHTRAFKWFPCIFPASHLHICSPGGAAGCASGEVGSAQPGGTGPAGSPRCGATCAPASCRHRGGRCRPPAPEQPCLCQPCN